mmetsp:Transcript_41034/g.59981  ORF Transcript_41034/g.59981 Transcript_41034/m.59981 type:complete len:311 (+) Transcript_41034:28-960(+)
MNLHQYCTINLLLLVLCHFVCTSIAINHNDYDEDYEDHWDYSTEYDDEDDMDIDPIVKQDLLRQLDFCSRAGVNPITMVAPLGDAGRGVVYMGEEPLPPKSTVGLYRALLVRKDVWFRWIDDGIVASGVWNDFWKAYTVEFTGELTENGVNKEGKGDSVPWMAIPVGDVGGDVDGPTWWNYGPINQENLQKAIEAINNKVIVDWRRLAASQDGKQLLLFNAHIINEPSPNPEPLEDDEHENISHLSGSGCETFDDGTGNELQYCGTAFEAKTSKTIYPGEEFLWCYGEDYQRDYPVASTCLNDKIRESQA